MTLTHLGASTDLPTDGPFTYATVVATGMTRSAFRDLVDAGVVRRLLKGVYAVAALPDTQLLRAQAIRLVVPAGVVVTDESAGWLAGAPMILRPGSHLETPPLTVFATDGHHRLRNALVDSGRRGFSATDLTELHGVRVTTPLRTFLDLGRLRHRDRAIAAMDQLLALGRFELEEVFAELPRFRGRRGVVQLRALTPLADARAESPPESALRLRFHDGGLPTPVPQHDVLDEHGRFLGRADLAVPELGFVAEYDGEGVHGPRQAHHDQVRRDAMRAAGWTVCVVRKDNLYGQHQDVIEMLWRGVHEARSRGARPDLG
ncbi:type IV toxin-antitoxin system AbiEi family antitoxin domain-containing protein [Nocardioides korecus]